MQERRNTIGTNNDFSDETQSFRHVNIFTEAKVLDYDDPYDTLEIKVSIRQKGGSSYIIKCRPLLPFYFCVKPQVGEIVKILIVDNDVEPSADGNAYWIGPTILQYQNLKGQRFIGRKYTPSYAISKKKEAIGLFPDWDKDVALLGKDNADIVLKPREVLIRAGKSIVDDPTVLNDENPAYIQLKIGEDGKQSFANILANKINLISHTGSPEFLKIMTDDEISKILDQAHPIPFGDNLKEILKAIIKFCLTHRHKGANTSTYDNIDVNELLDNLNSKNIKVN